MSRPGSLGGPTLAACAASVALVASVASVVSAAPARGPAAQGAR